LFVIDEFDAEQHASRAVLTRSEPRQSVLPPQRKVTDLDPANGGSLLQLFAAGE
jgi:hypothetical protein